VSLELAFERLRQATTFASVSSYIDASLQAPMGEYVNGLRSVTSDTPTPETKAVKDAVWGMISLSRQEVLVLDSPPVQRLRRIRQLGLGYLVYPTAGYSRFEHTLGAINQADRMLRAVASRTGRLIKDTTGEHHSGEQEILASRPIVRLAALLHDVGHLPLSHVSERFYGRPECSNAVLVDRVEALREEVAEHLGVKRPSLSECLSVATVLSPTFLDFLTGIVRYDPDEVRAAAAAIVGRAPSVRRAFIYQLITNVIDADKLDYMFRDGLLTGVPLAVDLERLLYKLKCVELPVENMPAGLATVREDDTPALVMAIDLGGQRLAYDVTVAREMLFERVYLHHKTRAAERVAMRRLEDFNAAPEWLLAYDDNLFSGPAPTSRLVRILRDRQLPRRAYAISYTYLAERAVAPSGEEPELPPEISESWRRLGFDLDRASLRRRLEEKILLTAQRIARALGDVGTVSEIWVDTVPMRGDLGTWDLWVETPDGELQVASTYSARAAAYAHSPAQTFYVYVNGARRAGEVAFMACEIVMATRYGLYTGRRAADHAKIPYRAVDVLKRRLEEAAPGIYDHLGRLRPEPDYLRAASGRERLGGLAERFHHYHGQPLARVGTERISSFLRQFPAGIGREMLGVLEKLEFLDREALGERFADFLGSDCDDDEVYVPLTARPEKSAAHLPYFLADDRKARLDIRSLPDALGTSSPITVFDDCNVSALQSRTAIQVWFGLPQDLPDEAAQLATPLDEELRDELRSRRVRIRFAYAHRPGLVDLIEVMEQVGLGTDVAAQVTEERRKPLEELPVSSGLRELLTDVGYELLVSTKGTTDPDKWTDERCQEFALGYGDRQQLVVLVYNTPTSAVTALWKGGTFRGAPWLPLFPRRGEPGVIRPSGQSA
jgi:HD superfamily phosphohydrolase